MFRVRFVEGNQGKLLSWNGFPDFVSHVPFKEGATID